MKKEQDMKNERVKGREALKRKKGDSKDMNCSAQNTALFVDLL